MADVFGKRSSRKGHLTCAWSEAKTWICGGEKRKIPGRKKQQEHREAGGFAGKELWMAQSCFSESCERGMGHPFIPDCLFKDVFIKNSLGGSDHISLCRRGQDCHYNVSVQGKDQAGFCTLEKVQVA